MKLKTILSVILAVLLLCSCGGKESEVTYDFPDRPGLVLGPRDSEKTAETPKPETPSKPSVSYVRKDLSGKLKIITGTFYYLAMNNKIEEFKKRYPNVQIELETIDSRNSTLTQNDYSKYSKRVDRILTGGEAVDIVSFIGLPYDELTGAGYFTDIAVFMDNDPGFNKDDYYMGIIDAFRQDEKLYAFCTNFMPEDIYSISDKAGADERKLFLEAEELTYLDMLAICENVRKPEDKYLFFSDNFNPASFFDSLRGSFVDFEYKDTSYNKDEFRRILTSVKNLPKMQNLFYTKSNAVTSVSATLIPHKDTDFVFVDATFPVTPVANYFNVGADGNPMQRQVAVGHDLYRFTPLEYFGITENSDNKELAWEFLKFFTLESDRDYNLLYTVDVYNGPGPVQKKMYEKYCSMFFQDAYDYIMKWNDNIDMTAIPPITPIPITEGVHMKATQIMLSFAKRCNTIKDSDAEISRYVWEEFYQYYEGAQSVERTSVNIDERVTRYLKTGQPQ